MDNFLVINARIRIPLAEFEFSYVRSSGPGGQNVNKVNSKAEAWVAVGAIVGITHAARGRLRGLAGRRLTLGDEVHISSETHRSQEGNRQEVMEKLRELIVQAMHEPKRRRKMRPSKGSIRRRLESKKRRGERV